MSELDKGVKFRGQATRDILRHQIRDALAQNYELSLAEMYNLIDYIGDLEFSQESLSNSLQIAVEALDKIFVKTGVIVEGEEEPLIHSIGILAVNALEKIEKEMEDGS